MRAVNIAEVGAASVVVNRLLETRFVAVAGPVVGGAPCSSSTASTASCTAASTPFSSVPAFTMAVSLPARLHPVVHALLLVVFVWAFVPVVAVLTEFIVVYPAGVTLLMHGNPAAHI